MKELKENILIAESISGQPICITSFTLDSEKPGKTLYIQGGVHGGEVTLNIIKKLYDYLKKNLICGKVIFVPYANPLSWMQTVYTYTVGKFSLKTGRDFNRVYETDYDINSKIADAILNLCKNADLTIDLHTAHESLPYSYFTETAVYPYLKALNFKINCFCGFKESFKHCFDYQLTKMGTKSITLECGSHDSLNPKFEQDIIDGLINVCFEMNLVKTAKNCSKDMIYYEQYSSIKTEKSGVVKFLKEVGENFKKGEPLFEVISGNLTEENAIYYAKEDGLVFRHSKTHIYTAFDEVMQVLYKTDIVPIETILKY